ncbi:isopentenyl-diphosphate Delta-isomerase [Luteibaculum oceani]|uniref:Isopentenyl-diphosphate delta-isomerase n=1 Tax=Luteibaculum oceani TaxID=1294296 RepID=A0A5C6VIT1_9FLAO|nr:isopentenyl-diphosphate Delta-isomerase [Luteibaculum oceani]TXC85343.1 isopentenyl-diphosphate Delta-isomerase [Luteibaculum oceani]
MSKDFVVLVNLQDEEIGVMEKMEAHEKGMLHRAFSVFLFNDKGEMLLQQRAEHKYHSGGLWTNTCCSHPKPGETPIQGANRRLMEEMGIQADLEHQFSFAYKSDYENGLSEHEFDHVFFGSFNEAPILNPEEAMDWKYIGVEDLEKEVAENPKDYTSWFLICLPRVIENYKALQHNG